MAQAAFGHADRVWLTSDNPRSEAPQAIIDEMRDGLPADATVCERVERREAIQCAVEGASPDDLVVIAGKGHEDYQEIAGERLPYSDRVVARQMSGGG